MASTPVDRVAVLTQGGHYAIISDIDPSSSDCLEGTLLVTGEAPRVFAACLDRNGLCRDRDQSANINISRSQALLGLINIIDNYNSPNA